MCFNYCTLAVTEYGQSVFAISVSLKYTKCTAKHYSNRCEFTAQVKKMGWKLIAYSFKHNFVSQLTRFFFIFEFFDIRWIFSVGNIPSTKQKGLKRKIANNNTLLDDEVFVYLKFVHKCSS